MLMTDLLLNNSNNVSGFFFVSNSNEYIHKYLEWN